MSPGSFSLLVLSLTLWPKILCNLLFSGHFGAGSRFLQVPSASFLFLTCGFALHAWRQMRHGRLNGPVSSDSQFHPSFCTPGLLGTYGWISHHTGTSTCFPRPSCLGLTWAHLLPFPLKSWPLISDFKASHLIGETFKVFIGPQVPTFQTA